MQRGEKKLKKIHPSTIFSTKNHPPFYKNLKEDNAQ